MNVVKNRPSNLTLEINVGSREAVVVVDDDLNNSFLSIFLNKIWELF